MEFETLQKDMVAAMKARDKVRKDGISSLISAVKKAAIDQGCRDDIRPELVDQGTSVANVIMWIFNILIAFFFPILTTAVGSAGTFVILGVFQLLCMIYFGSFGKS